MRLRRSRGELVPAAATVLDSEVMPAPDEGRRSRGAPESDTPIVNVNWQVTDLCNLGCNYCFSEERFVKGASLETGMKVVDWLVDVGGRDAAAVHLGFFGGEPLIKWDLIAQVIPYGEGKAIRAGKRITFGMVTNGTLATAKVVDTLEAHRFSIMLSVDGTPEVHDQARVHKGGRGSFRTMEANVRRILKAFPGTRGRMTVTPANVGSLAAGVKFLHEELGLRNVTAHPVIEADWSQSLLQTYEEQMIEVADYLCERLRSGSQLGISVLERAISGILGGGRREYPCGVARGFAGIDPNGEIYSCHRFISYARNDPAYRLGSVDSSKLPTRGAFADYSIARMHGCDGPGCDACDARVLCYGGCPAVFYKVTGSIYRTVPAYRPMMLALRGAGDRVLANLRGRPWVGSGAWLARVQRSA